MGKTPPCHVNPLLPPFLVTIMWETPFTAAAQAVQAPYEPLPPLPQYHLRALLCTSSSLPPDTWAVSLLGCIPLYCPALESAAAAPATEAMRGAAGGQEFGLPAGQTCLDSLFFWGI